MICSKLTYIKAWATRKRRDLWLQSQKSIAGNYEFKKKKKLQESIVRRVSRLEESLDEWADELPTWFGPSSDNVFTGEDEDEEDINSTDIHVILPRKYKHYAIGCVEAVALSVRIQMYRIKSPDALVAEPRIGGLVHALLRIFAFLPTECDGMMLVSLHFFSYSHSRDRKFY